MTLCSSRREFVALLGLFAVGCTMLDHGGDGLAGLHRELAGNARMYYGFDSGSAGTPSDRNAVLPSPRPA